MTSLTHICHFCHNQLPASEPKNHLMAKRFFHYVCRPCQTTYVHNLAHGYRGYFMETQTHRLYFFPFSSQFRLCLSNGQILIALDHLPDISPKNINQRIKQFLKLKAFA